MRQNIISGKDNSSETVDQEPHKDIDDVIHFDKYVHLSFAKVVFHSIDLVKCKSV